MADRSWYKAQLGSGRTFRMLQPKIVKGTHSAYFYISTFRSSCSGYAGQDLHSCNTLNNIHYYESQQTYLNEPNVKTVAILGFKIGGHCGVSDTPGWLATVAPFDGCSSNQSAVYAHELGHTFGLGHVPDGSLMDSVWACSGRSLGSCNLNSSQRSYLLNYRSNWFPSILNAAGATYDPDYVPYTEYSYLLEVPDPITTPPPPPPAPAPPPPTNIGATLGTNQRLYPNQELYNNGYALVYQTDGNLVDYGPGARVIWSSGTYGRSLGNLSMQGDGNLVLYNDYGGAMWFSGTNGQGDNNYLVLGADGNMIIETNHNIPIWGLYNGLKIPEYPPNTWGAQPSNVLYAHQILQPNQSLTTSGYRLTYQGDGHLVEYNSANQPIWCTPTYGQSVNNLKMQDDGNLVMYGAYGNAEWSTGTGGTGGSNYLIIQPDSNIVVYTNAGVPVWNSWAHPGCQ
ncbi:MAG TPA: hypothetical protein VLF79_02400 [Candidatus Saccharimonadales bacterium]|nr:hypothetical protein [Candidatus Saccharimonadales bacterium]